MDFGLSPEQRMLRDAVDRLLREPATSPGVRAVYVSPQKALAYDVERNLELPLRGIRDEGRRLGEVLAWAGPIYTR